MSTQGVELAVLTQMKIRFLKTNQSLYEANKHIEIYPYDLVYCPTSTIIQKYPPVNEEAFFFSRIEYICALLAYQESLLHTGRAESLILSYLAQVANYLNLVPANMF